MLIALAGVVAASGLVGLLDAAGMSDDGMADEGNEAQEPGGGEDLLAETDMPESSDHSAPPELEPEPDEDFETGGDMPAVLWPFPNAGEDEFISSDAPVPPPPNIAHKDDGSGTPFASGDGNDTLSGNDGHDWLDGGGGQDVLTGGAGNDTLIGGTGNDFLSGGDGDDSLVASGGRNALAGEAGDDILIGGEHADTLHGGTGDDTLRAGFGDDRLFGGEGNDLLMGGGGNDTLIGYAPGDADTSGADTLNGGDGDDRLVLGGGELASGGSGGDVFVLHDWIDPNNPATITDFNVSEDSLSIAYDADGPEPAVTTAYDEALGGMRVMVNGATVAVLSGVTQLGADAIQMEPTTPGFEAPAA
ncbi:calcium-binding protein [Pararhodobacter sp.]